MHVIIIPIVLNKWQAFKVTNNVLHLKDIISFWDVSYNTSSVYKYIISIVIRDFIHSIYSSQDCMCAQSVGVNFSWAPTSLNTPANGQHSHKPFIQTVLPSVRNLIGPWLWGSPVANVDKNWVTNSWTMGLKKANHASEFSPPPCLLRLGRREIKFWLSIFHIAIDIYVNWHTYLVTIIIIMMLWR